MTPLILAIDAIISGILLSDLDTFSNITIMKALSKEKLQTSVRAGDPSAGFNPLKFSTHLYLAIDSWFPPPPAKEDVLHLLDDLDMILNLKRLDVDVEGIALIDLERMSTMPLYKWATPACIVGVLDEGKITKVALAFERISLDAKCRTCTSPGFQKLDRSKNTPEHNKAGDDALTTFVNGILKETVNRLLSSNQNIDLLVALDIEKARAECAGIPCLMMTVMALYLTPFL